MGSHNYVTSDIDVLKGWPKTEKTVSSADVATALGLTVFQITARLKGMEGRGLIARDLKGLWGLTPMGKAERANPSPTISGAAKKMRAKDAAGLNSGPPDDSTVPRVKINRLDWAPSDDALKECQQRLPNVLRSLATYQTDKVKFKREIMALQVEKEHCEGVMNAKRRGKWTSRVVADERSHQMTTVYIAPDMREYVMASPWEVADLIIENPVKGISDTRLRLYSTSSVAKKAKRNEKLQQIEAAREIAKQQEVRNKRIRAAEDEEVLEFTVPADGAARPVPRRGDRGRHTPPRREKEDGRKPQLHGRSDSDSRRVGTGKGKVVEKVQSAPDPRHRKGNQSAGRNDRGGHGRNQQAGRR